MQRRTSIKIILVTTVVLGGVGATLWIQSIKHRRRSKVRGQSKTHNGGAEVAASSSAGTPSRDGANASKGDEGGHGWMYDRKSSSSASGGGGGGGKANLVQHVLAQEGVSKAMNEIVRFMEEESVKTVGERLACIEEQVSLGRKGHTPRATIS